MKKTILTLIAAALIFNAASLPAYAEDTDVVYVSIADENGNLVLPYCPVELLDADGNGLLTIDDALYMAHKTYYETGVENGYCSEVGDWGTAITKLWGVENGGSYGYYVDNTAAMSLDDSITADCYIAAFIYTDTSSFSDTYCYFNVQQYPNALAGENVSLTLYAAGYDENYAPISYPVAGAEITIDGVPSGIFTNDNGVALLSLDAAGNYVISAVSDTQTLVPPVCLVSVAEPAPQTGDLTVWYWIGTMLLLGGALASGRKNRAYVR